MQRLPIPRAEQLAVLAATEKGESYASILHRNYLALRGTSDAADLQAVHQADDVLVEGGNVREYTRVDFVDGGFFDMLGVRPGVGRVITPDDDRAGARVILISDGAWERFFARDPAVIGRRLSLRSQPFVVVGVMPSSFRGIRFNGSFLMAVPQSTGASLGIPEDRNYVNVVARLDPGATRATLGARLDASLHNCCTASGDFPADSRLSFVDASRGIPFGKSDFRDDYRLVLWLLMGGVLLVLLISCSNVGNLLLARGAAREREFAVRLSIGASRGRVVRQLLAESSLLAVLGGMLGVVLAGWATQLLVTVVADGLGTATALVEFHAKAPVLAFTGAVSAICVLTFGLGPALRATRADLVSSLKERPGAGAHARAVDRLLVIGQVAVTLVLVCGAGLLVATLRNLRATDPGFATDRLAGMEIETRGTSYERDGIVPLHQEILDRVRRVPGVVSVGMATRIPAIGGRNANFEYTVVGQVSREHAGVDLTAITPGYFAMAGTSLIGGRDFNAADTPSGARVAIVNDAFARRHFAARSPIGAEVRLDGLNGGETVTIVGVVHDVRFGDRRTRQDPMVYVPATQAGNWPFLVLMMRTASDPRRVERSVERALAAYARDLRLAGWQTVNDAYDLVILRERLAAGLASICAALALVLAMVGLSGLVGFSVARRTREIGVRMALGAQRSSVVWLVLRSALTMVGVGVAVGAPLALGAGRALGSLLYGIAATNVLLLGAAVLALLAVGTAASALPAWRASRVDPVASLRAD
jgi:predicted permease